GGLCNRDRRFVCDEGNMTRGRLAFLVLAALLLPLAVPSGTLAASFSITTPYPAVTVQAGNTVSFDLTVTTPTPERVDLALRGVPAGWTGTITGAGNSIDAVYTVGSPPPAVQLSVKVPQDAAAGTQTITVTATATATAAEGTRSLPISITVQSASSGGVTLTTDFAKLSGTVSSTFTYSLTLENNGTQQQTFTLQGQGPDGWQVEVHPSSNAQALTDTVPGGSSDTLSVTVTPPGTASAGAYPIQVVVAAGSQSAQVQLEADVTGSPDLTLTTPNQVLNAQVTAGGTGTVSLIVTNSGSVPLSGVSMTSTPPSGWDVTFSPSSIASLQAGDSQTVTATIHPPSDALTGDYDVTMTASGGGASQDVDIRTTVQTSPLWGFVGLALIAIVLVGLGWVFRRYGRR
ncbi:MAG TPA: NEW3 domain-containing protein, partial [Candidatus Acidoferrales bacterium]|nr:NEW3 domain-containing protein [Candidatus Acidoferrales bacterium]